MRTVGDLISRPHYCGRVEDDDPRVKDATLFGERFEHILEYQSSSDSQSRLYGVVDDGERSFTKRRIVRIYPDSCCCSCDLM